MGRARRIRAGAVALCAGGVALLLAIAAAEAAPPKTLEPGKLNVALNGDMPMTGLKDGKLIGTDGDLMVLIAERLGLEVVPHMMEWSAEIQSTKQGKVDIMHGAMGWIKARSEVMLLTDPIYYFGTLLAQKQDTNWSTFEDMKGRSVATVSGFTLVPELKAVEGIGEVKLYDTTDGALRDLIAGRVDMAILDPPLMQLAIQQNPDWKLHQVALKPEPDKYPIMSQEYNVIFGINPERERARTTPSMSRSPRSGPTAPTSKSWPSMVWATRAGSRRRPRARTCATGSTGRRTGWRRAATTASEIRPGRAAGRHGETSRHGCGGHAGRLRSIIGVRQRRMEPLLRIVDLHKSFGALEV